MVARYTANRSGGVGRPRIAASIAFRAIVIQRDWEDLVAASFGRGIFVLDDYSPIRDAAARGLDAPATLFDTRDALWYDPVDVEDSQGASQYAADAPRCDT